MNRNFLVSLITKELEYNQSPESNLMRAVIRESFLDVMIISNKSKYIKRKREAQEWLEGDSEDFHLVCLLAQVIPKKIQELYELVKTYNNNLKY